MSLSTHLLPVAAGGGDARSAVHGGWAARRARRLVRGREQDPRWVRPALLALLALTAAAYLWDLSASGWANSFYAAAVQAATKSWKALFFGSSDSSNFITVDKPPAALWVMDLSARLFGLSSWSILVPEVLEGVATVAVLYATVRRWWGPAAGLIAGLVLALTPVAVLMFRYNNPDALLVLLLTGAAYALTRALEGPRSTRWLMLAGALVGTGFLTKMLQAFLVLPVFAVLYLVAGHGTLRRRAGELVAAGVALVVASGWWVLAVQLTPAHDRPYIGGSQDNSLFNLILGYNGVGRLDGVETGSVGGSGPIGSRWGATGWRRLFGTEMGGQISWLIPTALVLLAVCLWLTRRGGRQDRARASLLLWGGTLVVTGVVFSFADGIIHPYYTVALAPAVGALVGIGTVALWRRRDELVARLGLAAAIAAGAVWADRLLLRTPTWLPSLRTVVLVVGLAAALGVALYGALPARWRPRAAAASLVVAAACLLAGPAAYAATTIHTPHSGAVPSAGPSTGPGGPGAGRGGGFAGGHAGFPGAHAGAPTVPGGTAAGGFGAGPGGGPGGARGGGGAGGGPATGGPVSSPARSGAGGPQAGGGLGGLLSGATPSAAVTRLLTTGASHYTWVAATVGSENAAGYQLASRDPVMAIGGFNGTDPAPSLAEFERYVHQGKIHYFIATRGATSSSDVATQITRWVQAHYRATTVDGVTLYDLAG